MACLNEVTNNIHTSNSFGAMSHEIRSLLMAESNTSLLLFDSGKLQISGVNRRRVRFDPKSIQAKSDTLGSLVISEMGEWHYAVYQIKTQFLGIGERKPETFQLCSKDGKRFAVTIVLVGGINGAIIEELETNISFG